MSIPENPLNRREILKGMGMLAAGAGISAFFAPNVAKAAGETSLQVYNVKSFGAIGNGSNDDTISIQNAINAGINAGGGIVFFPSGKYRITNTVQISDQVIIQGIGWEDTLFAQGPTASLGNGSWIFVDTINSAFLINGTGVVVQNIAINYINQNQNINIPSWTPNLSHDYAIKVRDNLGTVLLENIFLRNPTRGIYLGGTSNAVGRITLKRIYGQPLLEGIVVDNAMDIIKISDVHFWPFWALNNIVHSYQRNNSKAFISRRNDNPHFTDIFVFGYKYGFLFENSLVITNPNDLRLTQRFLMTNIGLDAVNYGIYINNVIPAGSSPTSVTGTISNMYIHGAGTPYGTFPQGVFGIGTDAGTNLCRLQINNLHISNMGANGIRLEGSGNIIMVENVWIEEWNKTTGGFPAVEALAGNSLIIGRTRLFERGHGGLDKGGAGSITLDT